MILKHYNPFLVYCLEIFYNNEFVYYVGAHARPSQKYLTEHDILNFSGNPLKRNYKKLNLTREEYFNSIKILHIEEFSDLETTFAREKELIKEYKKKYGDKCVNKTLNDSRALVGKTCSAEANAKRKITMTGRKLSDATRERQSISHRKRVMDVKSGKVYESMGDLANELGVKSPSVTYGIANGLKRYEQYKVI